jgi:5-(carboxyamino)imidazole ribonucleotide mutase
VTQATPLVSIVMGSASDRETMHAATEMLDQLGITCEELVLSAHRMPDETFAYAADAQNRGIKVIVAGAGGAAHLPGIVAAKSLLPVIGVPIESKALRGLDSLLSIVQMPKGVPVATVGIGNAANAALLAARILAIGDSQISQRLEAYVARMRASAKAST